MLPDPSEKSRAVRAMFDRIAPRYDLVNRVMTLGLDVGWRRRTVAALGLPPGSLVLDLACGTGDLCRELEAAGYRALGLDYSAGMLERAHTGAPLVQADALDIPLRDALVDGVVSGFALRNVTDLGTVFAEAARCLRPGGRIALLEVSAPRNPVARAGHRLYIDRIVPLIGAVLSDRAAYRYLPASVAYLPPTAELVSMLAAAGFGALQAEQLRPGAAQVVTGTRATVIGGRDGTPSGPTRFDG